MERYFGGRRLFTVRSDRHQRVPNAMFREGSVGRKGVRVSGRGVSDDRLRRLRNVCMARGAVTMVHRGRGW